MFPLPPWPTSGRFYLAHVVMDSYLTMREVALITGFSMKYLEALVLGNQKPSYEHARILEHAIGCELEEFLHGPHGHKREPKGEARLNGKAKGKAKARPNGKPKGKARPKGKRGAAATD